MATEKFQPQKDQKPLTQQQLDQLAEIKPSDVDEAIAGAIDELKPYLEAEPE